MQTLGGFFTQGKTDKESSRLMNDAKSISQAGAFSMVIEAIPEEVASDITQSIEVPTIGIGAGRNCDGQILVSHDILNLYGAFTPKFVKKYGEIDKNIVNAVKEYSQEVKKKKFPTKDNIFTIKK